MAGCSLIDYVAPPQYDESGVAVPDSREPTELVKGIADVVPYGETGLAVFMFLVAGFERFKRNKTEKGLKATLMAGKKVAKDPELQKHWEKIKEIYKIEHENTGTYSFIKLAIAKLPKLF